MIEGYGFVQGVTSLFYLYSWRALALVCTLIFSAGLYAGPPLNTDDTGLLVPGEWELILSFVADKRTSGNSYSAPGFEANYGLTPNTQMTASLGRAKVAPAVGSSKSDFDAATLEYKWRFFTGDKTALAVVPAYSFPLTGSSTDRGVVDDVKVFSLPVVGTYATGPWEFNAQVSYEMTSSGPNTGFYGASAAYTVTDALTVLGEIYGVAAYGEKAEETGFNIGLDYTFARGWALLFSVGTGINSNLPNVEDELDTSAFLGVRYVTGE